MVTASQVGLAQDWREIRTPPTRRDILLTYERGDVLDPLDDPARWQGMTHGQSAKAVSYTHLTLPTIYSV